MNGISEEMLPEPEFFVPILDTMVDTSEDVFLAACKAALAINVHFEVREENFFMHALRDHPKNEHFGEALIHLLNEQGYPYEDEILLRQCIKCVKDIFASSSTASYFFTNDLKVLFDIAIREIGNLPQTDTLRVIYIGAIGELIQKSPWVEQGRYRRADIVKVLEDILDTGGDDEDGYNEEALDAVQDVLHDCQDLLEE